MKVVQASIVLVVATVTACGTSVIITTPDEVPKYVGRKITLVGEVSNSKVPQILGVDVRSDSADLRGRMAKAIGVLVRYEVSEAEIAKMDRLGIAHRGPGSFYRLRTGFRNTTAHAVPR